MGLTPQAAEQSRGLSKDVRDGWGKASTPRRGSTQVLGSAAVLGEGGGDASGRAGTRSQWATFRSGDSVGGSDSLGTEKLLHFFPTHSEVVTGSEAFTPTGVPFGV